MCLAAFHLASFPLSVSPCLTGRKTIFDNDPMGGQLIIEQLEFRGRCGVTSEERARPQLLAVDLELDCRLTPAGRSDDLRHTVDYATVAARIVELGTSHESRLLEAMAERFLTALFDEFCVDRIKLWLRKLHPPITQVARSMGITVERTKLTQHLIRADPPPPTFSSDSFRASRKARSSTSQPAQGGMRCSWPRWATRLMPLIATSGPGATVLNRPRAKPRRGYNTDSRSGTAFAA